jgi:hypothetical protein
VSNPVDSREVNSWWECSICRRQFDNGIDRMVHIIDEYTICQKCYNRGILHSIREAWREECLRKGNDY